MNLWQHQDIPILKPGIPECSALLNTTYHQRFNMAGRPLQIRCHSAESIPFFNGILMMGNQVTNAQDQSYEYNTPGYFR